VTAALWIGCAAAGALGSVTRALASAASVRAFGARLPWGTAIANLSGALLLGLLHGAGVHGSTLTLLAAGLLGSLTTFSTWTLETLRLASTRPVAAAVNLLVQLAAGVAFVALGELLGGLA